MKVHTVLIGKCDSSESSTLLGEALAHQFHTVHALRDVEFMVDKEEHGQWLVECVGEMIPTSHYSDMKTFAAGWFALYHQAPYDPITGEEV